MKTLKKSQEVQNYKCLMIKINNKQIFTERRNERYVKKAINKIGGTLFIVKVEKAKLLSLKQIVNRINSSETPTDEVQFKVIRKIYTEIEEKEIKADFSNSDLTMFIKKEILSKKEISVNILHELLKAHDVKKCKIRYYLTKVRKELIASGFKFA